LMLLTMISTTILVDAMLTGVSEAEQQMTIHFVHIMAFSMPASVVLHCLAAGEIALGKTRVTNARASILNVGVILGLCMLVLTDKGAMLAIAFTLSFNALAVWALWTLWREGDLSFEQLSPADVWSELRLFIGR